VVTEEFFLVYSLTGEGADKRVLLPMVGGGLQYSTFSLQASGTLLSHRQHCASKYFLG